VLVSERGGIDVVLDQDSRDERMDQDHSDGRAESRPGTGLLSVDLLDRHLGGYRSSSRLRSMIP